MEKRMELEDLQNLCSEKLKEKASKLNLDDPTAIYSFMQEHQEEMFNDFIEEAVKRPIRPILLSFMVVAASPATQRNFSQTPTLMVVLSVALLSR